MTKYIVEVDRDHNADCEVFDTLAEANRAAEDRWYYLTDSERRKTTVAVWSLNESCLMDEAFDGDEVIDWTLYHSADYPCDAAFINGELKTREER